MAKDSARLYGLRYTSDQWFAVGMCGPTPEGPRLCLMCQCPFRAGELWTRYTSAADAGFGRYSYGIHQDCQLEAAKGN